MKRVLSVLALLATTWCGCGKENEFVEPPPPPVTTAKPVVQTVSIYLDQNGETEAVERADVRARVKGFLEEVNFTQGQDVDKDDVLYQIERTEYKTLRDAASAKLDASAAAVKVAEAGLETAKVAQQRAEEAFIRQDKLLKRQATSQEDWEKARAEKNGAIANVAAAQANIDAAKADVQKATADLNQAELDYGYTEVKAPISGMVERTKIKVGNLVEDGTILTTVVKSQPIWANFSISERDLLALQKSSTRDRSERLDLTEEEILVELQRQGDTGYPFRGRLDYYDPEVDRSTGTLGLRAVFENADNLLLPGYSVTVRVSIGEVKDALLVPEKALGQDMSGAYLLVVAGNNVVERKNVVVGGKYGNMVVIREGIATSDSVIIEGLQRARPGSEVKPTSTTLSAPPEALQSANLDNSETSDDGPSGP